MTNTEKINRVKVLLQNDATATTEVVQQYLNVAKDVILQETYPYLNDFGYADFPEKYDGLQCELASRYFARRGALGETIHNENGINRTWDTADDRDLLDRIIPIARIV